MLRRIFPAAALFAGIAAFAIGAVDENDIFNGLKFRNLGPSVGGGRVAAVTGIPGDPNIYYIGAAGGGVWKTTDAGHSWKDIFKDEGTSSIGAVTLAPSNPNLVWVGTGEAKIRNDVLDGQGVYLSPDAGQSWTRMGLADAGQISQIVVDPTNPNNVIVGALGHPWVPNATRGVFRSTDGGRNWQKTLFVDETTGCADLAMEPGNPMVLFAAMWQVRRYPWTLDDGGPGSGLYRSIDGGATWKKLTNDLPEGPLGRIAVAFAPSNPQHVYALVEAKKGLLWESRNLGDDWKEVTDNHELDVRPFYFSRLFVSPENEARVYFLSYRLMASDDGGHSAKSLDHGVHPDHHALWIDPSNPSRMIQGNDGGVYLTSDRGQTWHFCDNIPIEQFYMVAAGPGPGYRLCGGLQDNSAWCGPSNSFSRSGIAGSDWFVVAGGDGEYAIPAPTDPDIIYADSQNGSIQRLDYRTKLSLFARPYLPGVEQMAARDLKYRFNWTSPIAVSPKDADTVYLGGNVLFKSTDGAKTWTPASGDLTRNDRSKQEISGGSINYDISGAETYGTIVAITLSDADPNVIWVGTDDGLVQVTRDGGKTWDDVARNIPHAPQWERVYQVGVSPFDSGAAFVAFDGHELGDRHPHVFKTADFGRSWKEISKGLADDTPVYVVREDPNRKGLLVAGTETGISYSPDGGASWRRIKGELPTAPVWDLKFVQRDLVLATHGRGLFVLDDVRGLEAFAASGEPKAFALLSTSDGTITRLWSRQGFGGGSIAPNPSTGVVVDYYLPEELKTSEAQKKSHETPVKIEITDADGRLVNTTYGPSKKGLNRETWDLRWSGPTKLTFEKTAGGEDEFFNRNAGPTAAPGAYTVAITSGGRTEKRTVQVGLDARYKLDAAGFRAQTDEALASRAAISRLNEMLNRIDAMQKTITGFDKSLPKDTAEGRSQRKKYETALKSGEDLDKKLEDLKSSVYNTQMQHEASEDDIHYLQKFHDELSETMFFSSFAFGEPPNPALLDYNRGLRAELDGYLSKFDALLQTDVAAHNKTAAAAGAPTVFVGEPIPMRSAGS